MGTDLCKSRCFLGTGIASYTASSAYFLLHENTDNLQRRDTARSNIPLGGTVTVGTPATLEMLTTEISALLD